MGGSVYSYIEQSLVKKCHTVLEWMVDTVGPLYLWVLQITDSTNCESKIFDKMCLY
jgi:hypothetical protein